MKRIPMLFLLAGAWCARAYVPYPIDGPAHHRPDFASVQFLASQNIAAGLTTAGGNVWITADSDPTGAINAAIGTWNAVPTSAARFAPIQTTNAAYSLTDTSNQIVFSDDPLVESFTGGILAITADKYYTSDPGTIIGSDVFFTPYFQFSTTQAAGTFDLQSILTHELGHALGANHTNILSATMWYTTSSQDIHQQTLGADDIAFVSALYPPAGGNGYGVISGVTTVAGSPLLGGAITAVDPNTGITVGGFSSVMDGSFSFQVPPGNYYVYVEPAGGLALYDANPQVAVTSIITTAFESGFAGSNSQPSLLQVQAGATATANLNAGAGISPLKAPLGAFGTAGVTGDYHGNFTALSISVSSGQTVDFVFGNTLSSAVTESNLQILGPATLRPGTLRRDPTVTLPDGSSAYRFTLDIPPLPANGAATLVLKSGTDILTRSGLFDLTRPQSVNAGSFLGGPVAPGEILSFFGAQLGPPAPASNGGFGTGGTLPTSLAGITVSFDQTQAPLFYVSNSQINLQVPYEIASQSSTLMTVFYNGAVVAKSTLSVGKSAPGIFVVTNADGSANGPNAPGSAGGILVIYGTGAGITTGLLRTGAAAPANSTIAAAVTIGGIPVTPIFAGLTPGSVGLVQVNVAIPAGTPSGNTIPLQFSMNGTPTQTVNISVQ